MNVFNEGRYFAMEALALSSGTSTAMLHKQNIKIGLTEKGKGFFL